MKLQRAVISGTANGYFHVLRTYKPDRFQTPIGLVDAHRTCGSADSSED